MRTMHNGMKKKSLKLNMMLSTIKSIMDVIFPFFTFPYVSRVLGVENIGKYNFASSVINYFILFSGLGISTYAIREGAAIRENPIKLKKFSNEMFTINMLSTVVSYVLLGILLVYISKFHSYWPLLIILSFQCFFKAFGMEWIYSVYEDYAYISIRSILFQFLSLVLMFLLVKEQDDVEMYAMITVIACVGSNVFNFFHLRKSMKVKLTRCLNLKKHIKPILVLFAMNLAVSIYVSSDMTILGFMCDDRTVGIYSVSVKVYGIVKRILSSILIVSIPRLSVLYGNNDLLGFKKTGEKIYKGLLTIVFPSIVGIIILREPIVRLVAGEQYLEASYSLMLLSIALFFCMAAWFWSQCVLIPIKQEAEVFRVTIVSAILNILLNFILVPMWKEKAAALSTIVAEACSYFWCAYKGKKCTKINGFLQIILKVSCGIVGIVIVSFVTQLVINDYLLYMTVTVIGSIAVYFVIEIVLKNEVFTDVCKLILMKMKRIAIVDKV